MPKEELYQIEPTGPNWQASEVKNEFAAARGKSNLRVEDEGKNHESMFSKSVQNKEGMRDNVLGLKREFRLLQKLEGTQVVPKAYALKTSPDGKEAHLLMQGLKGKSFEGRPAAGEVEKGQAEQTIARNLVAMDKIHDGGVLLIDINKGSFVMDGLGEKGQEVVPKIVDFELAEGMDNLSSIDVQTNLFRSRWYKKDIGFDLAASSGRYEEVSQTDAKNIEQYLTLRANLEYFIGSRLDWDINPAMFNKEDMTAYEQQLAKLQPALENMLTIEILLHYEDAKKRDVKFLRATPEAEVAKELPSRMKFALKEAMVNINLPYLMQQRGIKVSPELMKFMQESLSPFLQDRPREIPEAVRDIAGAFTQKDIDVKALEQAREQISNS